MEIFPKKEICNQTIGHINRTLSLFELHQYLISLLRKTQNTFSEPPVKKKWVMGIFPKEEIINQMIENYFLDHVSG